MFGIFVCRINFYPKRNDLKNWTRGYSSVGRMFAQPLCLRHTPYKPNTVVCNHKPSTQGVVQEDQKSKVVLSNTVSSRLAWDTWDPVSEYKQRGWRKTTDFQNNQGQLPAPIQWLTSVAPVLWDSIPLSEFPGYHTIVLPRKTCRRNTHTHENKKNAIRQ